MLDVLDFRVNVSLINSNLSKWQFKGKLKTLQAGTPDFIKSFMGDLSQHITEEESANLVALDKSLSTTDAEGIAKSFGRTRAFVPSRSHPLAPNKSPFETVAGLMTALLSILATCCESSLTRLSAQTIYQVKGVGLKLLYFAVV